MTPNHVTAVSAAFTYLGIGILATVRPSWASCAIVSLLLLLGYALDSADGQLARLTQSGRASGEWLDHVIDMGKICLLFSAVTLSWVQYGVPGFDHERLVVVPLVYLAVMVVGVFGWLLADLLVRSGGSPPGSNQAPVGSEPAPVMRSLLRLPGDYGLLALTFLWFSTPLFAATFTLLMIANAVILTAALPVWFRQVRESEESL